MLDDQQKYVGTREECENWLKDKTGPLASRFKIVQGADVPVVEALTEAAEDEEIEIVDDEAAVEEIPAEEPVAEDEPRQVICECDKCGALVIKDEADVVVDEETDLVNVEEECKFCEEAKGFKIIGAVAPYEPAEPVTEAFESFKKSVAWGKLKDTHKLIPCKLKDFKKGDLMINDDARSIKDVNEEDVAFYVVNVAAKPDGDISVKLASNGVTLGSPEDEYIKVVKNVNEAFESFKKPIAWSKLKATHKLVPCKIKDFKKGDLMIERESRDINASDLDDELASYVVSVKPDSDGDLKVTLGTNGTVVGEPGLEYLRAVKNDGVKEDLADVARKVFDKPASTKTQQAWEDELNGECGEISDKRRKHLEKNFAQQRDWEERHPDKEAKY
jgi:hypothetical protein